MPLVVDVVVGGLAGVVAMVFVVFADFPCVDVLCVEFACDDVVCVDFP